MVETKTLRELTMIGIDTILTSLEGKDVKGDPILNITKMQKKIDDSGKWVSVEGLKQKLQEKIKYYEDCLREFSRDGSVNKEWFIIIRTLKELLAELEGEKKT